MPEYLAPGVYVEEVSFRSKSIEGVSTTTTGFIGPAAYGPLNLAPELVTSLEEYERLYGSGDQLRFTNEAGDEVVMTNYLWHATRAHFAEGGRRLYIARVFRPAAGDDGYAAANFPAGAAAADQISVRARFPGRLGNMRVRFTLRLGPNVLSSERVDEGGLVFYRNTVGALADKDIVWIDDELSPAGSPAEGGAFYRAVRTLDPASASYKWTFEGRTDIRTLETLDAGVLRVRAVSLAVTTIPASEGVLPQTWGSALDPEHRRNGAEDSLADLFPAKPTNHSLALSLPIVITAGANLDSGVKILEAMLAANSSLLGGLLAPILPGPLWRNSSDLERSLDIVLVGGNDGMRPSATEYEGRVDPIDDAKTGLKLFEDLEDISIVAAPGSSYGYERDYRDDAQAVMAQLIIHASYMRYRIAVLDCSDGQSISEVRELRAKLNSKYAALYYPWVRVLDPITRRQISLPPSGFITGIYTRNDTLRAVYKAPANEVVNLALGFENMLNKAQQEVLNPEGINCFRFFEGRGYLLWGARTVTDDQEWKYVNLRRYFAYLERSIDRGTQWAVFEPNDPYLWAGITRTIETYLLNEWTRGALLGEKPDKAFFVRCDRSTMTQNDLDNGRMVCLIGVAPVRPAEFVIFRIGQWTGDAQR
jgi:phage tail sheath protein FI